VKDGQAVVGSGVNEFLIRKAGQIVGSLEEWKQLAPPPEPEREWGAGKAAQEWAGSFFGKDGLVQVPLDLAGLLNSQAQLGPVRLTGLIPEYRVKLDSQPGGSWRCHGLATGACREGRVAVMVHARTEEGFGPRIGDQLKRSKPGSQWALRMSRMAESVLGVTLADCGTLRADLVLLAAAALLAAEGEKAGSAILVFQEFRPKETRPLQLQQNSADLDAFARALGGKALKPGFLTGPFRVPGGHEVPASVPLYLGKTVTPL